MAGEIVTLSEESVRRIKRELDEQKRELTNLRRHLTHVATRHRESVWMPGGGSKACEYLLNGVTGWTDQGTNTCHLEGQNSPKYGWINAWYGGGPAAEIGLSVVNDAAPETYGTWQIEETATYKLSLNGTLMCVLKGIYTYADLRTNWDYITHNVIGGGGGTVNVTNFLYALKEPRLRIELWRKPPGGVMAKYQSSGDEQAYRNFEHVFPMVESDSFCNVSREWLCEFDAGDRITLRFYWGVDGYEYAKYHDLYIIPTTFAGDSGLRVRFERMQDAHLSWDQLY